MRAMSRLESVMISASSGSCRTMKTRFSSWVSTFSIHPTQVRPRRVSPSAPFPCFRTKPGAPLPIATITTCSSIPTIPIGSCWATDGGLYISHDRAKTWLHVNTLPIAEFYAISVDAREPYKIWGGTQDNGMLGGEAKPMTPRAGALGVGPRRRQLRDPDRPERSRYDVSRGHVWLDGAKRSEDR